MAFSGRNVILLLLLIFVNFENIAGSKILFLYPVATRSETHVFLPLAKELAKRSHDVTIISPNNLSSVPSSIRQIVPTTYLMDTHFFKDVYEERERAKHRLSYLFGFDPSFMAEKCEEVYEHEGFRKIWKETFDLIIMSGWFNGCFNGLIHQWGAPFILFTTMPTPNWLVGLTGFHPPPSFVSLPIMYQDKMNFQERMTNTAVIWIYSFLESFYLSPMTTSIYRKYLNNDALPLSSEIDRNVSMVFSNSHAALTHPRPFPPDVIEVGGIHCREPKALDDKELDNFISGGQHGTIFFSMGSMVQSRTFPEKARKIFSNVFSRLKQRVLWKWDAGYMEDLPPNVRLGKWLPQQDILGHPNIKLFITHGGLLSTMEAAFYGVPLIGVPVFVDQDSNMNGAEINGYAVKLEILDLTEEILEETINRVLNNSTYSLRAKEISKIFRDQPQPALERAAFWSEFVIRHKGASHLRSASRDLNFFQYDSMDCYLFVVAVFALVCVLIFVMVKISIRFCKACFQFIIPSPRFNSGKSRVKTKRQ